VAGGLAERLPVGAALFEAIVQDPSGVAARVVAAGQSREWRQVALQEDETELDAKTDRAPSALDANAMWTQWTACLSANEENRGVRKAGTALEAADLDRWFGVLTTDERHGTFSEPRSGSPLRTLDPRGVFGWHMLKCLECREAGALRPLCVPGRGLVGLARHGVRAEAVLLNPKAPIPTTAQAADGEEVQGFVEDLIAQGKVARAPHAGVLVAPLFVTTKGRIALEEPDGTGGRPGLRYRRDVRAKARLVTDMRKSGMNEACIDLPFRYGDFPKHLADCAAQGCMWAGSFDFKSFYHSIRLSHALRRWAAIRDAKGRLWVFMVLPFGARFGCFVASLVMAELLGVMRACGWGPVYGYIDDGRTAGASEAQANEHLK